MTEHSEGVRLLAKVPRKESKKVRKEGSKEAIHVQRKRKRVEKTAAKKLSKSQKLKSWGILSAVGINLELGGV